MNQQRQQYLAIKSQHPDSILFLRSGDFYEAFDNDARRVAETCGLVLTSRKIAEDVRIPLVGVFYHALDRHVAELLDREFMAWLVVPGGRIALPHAKTIEQFVTMYALLTGKQV